MPALPELQRGFANSLRDAAVDAPAVVIGGAFQAGARLAVYRNNYRVSLERALADCFPVLARLVGEGFFGYMADAYLRAHPSRSGNLHEFGAALPGFLAGFAATAAHAYLADVAALEWAWQQAYHAADHPPLDMDRMAKVPVAQQESMRFLLHPSCRLLASAIPVVSVWLANQADIEDAAVAAVNLDAGGETALVHRPAMQVLVRRTSAAEHVLVSRLRAGDMLADACETALRWDPAFDLGACMLELVRSGVIVDFQYG